MKNNSYLFLVITVFLLSSQHFFGQAIFTDVTQTSGINHAFHVFQGTFGGGVAVVDYNNDGYEDLFIAGGLAQDVLYKNNGDGTFLDVTEVAGLERSDIVISQGVVSADVNRDGFVDLFVTTIASIVEGEEIPRASDILYLNNGDGTFIDASAAYGLNALKTFSTGAAFGDFNADGYPDLFVGNYFHQFDGDLGVLNGGTITGAQKPSYDQLYINQQGNSFIEVSHLIGEDLLGFGFGGVFTDIDNDQDLDILIINDFGGQATPNQLLVNEYPLLKFTNVSEEMKANFGINAMGTAIGDYDNNGWMDYYISNIASGPFLVNPGNNQAFIEMSNDLGANIDVVFEQNGGAIVPVGWGTLFFDYDQDTDLDLFIANGCINPPVVPNPNLFLENKGLAFENNSEALGLDDPGIGRGAVYFDFDKDGDLDLFVVNQIPLGDPTFVETVTSKLYRNDTANGNWLQVKLQGIQATTRGLGARVEAVMGNLKIIREIDGGSSHESQNSTLAHFGLGDHNRIDSLIVKWPGGNSQYQLNVLANQAIEITEKVGKSPFEKEQMIAYPTIFDQEITLNYQLTKGSHFSLSVFDIQGRKIETLVNKGIGYAGNYLWQVPNHLSPGIYLFVLQTETTYIVSKGLKR